MTAGELMARLKDDPEYQEAERAREEARAARARRIDVALKPIVRELRDVGVVLENWNELVERYSPLTGAVASILLSWLARTDDVDVQEMLVRALAAARPTEAFDGRPLADVFDKTSSDSLRWAIANTLSVASVTHISDWVVHALRRRDSGKAREMLSIAAARLGPHEAANETLLSVLSELPGHAAMGVALSGTTRELPALQAAATVTKGWKRKAVEKAIRAIEKRSARGRDNGLAAGTDPAVPTMVVRRA